MKKKELAEYKNKSIEELEKELANFRSRLSALKWDLIQGKVKNIREIRQIKKTVAQILTLIRLKKS
jgi:ribosomal protein L29